MEGQLCFSTNLSSVEGLPSPDQGSNKGAQNFKKALSHHSCCLLRSDFGHRLQFGEGRPQWAYFTCTKVIFRLPREWTNLRNFRSGKGLQAVVDLSKSGDGLTIHFDTLQPYIGWVCFRRYLAYFKLTKEGSWKLHPELSEVGIEQ